MTISRKQIEITVIFADNGESLTVSDLRMNVALSLGLNSIHGILQASIEGLTLDIMQRLTTVGFIQANNRMNNILVKAGNDGEELALIHAGTIDRAFIDATYQPSPTFNIYSGSALSVALTAPPATSYNGSVSIDNVFHDLARSAGLAFKNFGVNNVVENPYLTGSTLDKIKILARSYDIDFSIDKKILTIWRQDGIKDNKPLIISPSSMPGALIGYPQYSGDMLELRTLFSPVYDYSTPLLLESHIDIYNRTWYAKSIIHNLQSQTPNGAWFSDLKCVTG